jgi:hypothetical protein
MRSVPCKLICNRPFISPSSLKFSTIQLSDRKLPGIYIQTTINSGKYFQYADRLERPIHDGSSARCFARCLWRKGGPIFLFDEVSRNANLYPQIDYKKVAHYFGNDTTYDTIHSRFRKAINESKRLIKEAEGRDMSAVTPSKKGKASPSKTTSPIATNGTKKRVNSKMTPVFEFKLC